LKRGEECSRLAAGSEKRGKDEIGSRFYKLQWISVMTQIPCGRELIQPAIAGHGDAAAFPANPHAWEQKSDWLFIGTRYFLCAQRLAPKSLVIGRSNVIYLIFFNRNNILDSFNIYLALDCSISSKYSTVGAALMILFKWGLDL